MLKLIVSLSIFIMAFQLKAKILCDYGEKDTCPTGMYCTHYDDANQAVCRKMFSKKLPELYFPFAKDKPVKCWKAVDPNANSSHAWDNTHFAIDLHTKKDDLGNIYAGQTGRVVAFGGCLAQDPNCNSGFGNQIKILAANGILLFYSHLSDIHVKTGDIVREGQLIGKEGFTGNVGGMWGKRGDFHHLHLSVHYNWKKYSLKFHDSKKFPGLPSIPFKLKMCSSKNKRFCRSVSRDIRDIKCNKFNRDAPFLRGSGK